MENEKKYFLSQDSMLDGDSADFVVTQNSWVNAENVRMGSTDAGVIGTVESIGSNVSINDLGDNYLCIGNATDEENKRFVTLWKDLDNLNDKILCTYTDTNTTYTVLEGKDVFISPPARRFNTVLQGSAPNQIILQQNFDNYPGIYYVFNSNIDGFYNVTSASANLLTASESIANTSDGRGIEDVTISKINSNSIRVFCDNKYITDATFPSGREIIISNTSSALDGVYVTTGIISKTSTYIDLGIDTGISPLPVFTTVTGDINFRVNSFVYFFYTSERLGELFTTEPINSARIANGLLYWCDGENNEPRKINIESGIKLYNPEFNTSQQPYEFPILKKELTVIKETPVAIPSFQKKYDANFSQNFISSTSFEFALQYIYWDGETSVVSIYTTQTELNPADQNFNYIEILINNSIYIPSSVMALNIISRQLDGTRAGGTFASVIKTWDKRDYNDFLDLLYNNIRTSSLSFNYYNDFTGQIIAQDDVLRPFDNVPIYSKSLEVARNRLFLANNTEGYNLPSESGEMIVELNAGGQLTSLTLPLIWIYTYYYIQGNPNGENWYSGAFYVNIPNSAYSQPGYYKLYQGLTGGYLPGLPDATPPSPLPTTEAFSSLTYISQSLDEVLDLQKYIPVGPSLPDRNGDVVNNNPAGFLNSSLVTITGLPITCKNVFLPKSTYKYGYVFYDEYLRKSSVVTKDEYTISIPERTFIWDDVPSNVVTSLRWSISITNKPSWAKYVAPVFTKNQKTSFFIASYSDAPRYARKNTDGTFNFDSGLYGPNTYGIAINTNPLNFSELGYVYNEGDFCRIIVRNKAPNPDTYITYEAAVLNQVENYIIIKPTDIGALGTDIDALYEIYTPYKSSENEPFYEIGDIRIAIQENPIFPNNINGTIQPDTYAVKRTYNNFSYFSEAMSPNDKYYRDWTGWGGKVNFTSLQGQSKKTQFISWSDGFIPNTSLNGLSTFRLGNEISVPQDCGEINKLQLTSKIQAEGTVMLSICSSETNSMYLGETQIVDSTGAVQFFSANAPVISTINTLKGSFGTTNPESVVEFRGRVYYADANKGVWVQYAENGLSPISNYKMTRFWKRFFAQYLSMTKAEIEALGSRPYIFSGFDSNHLELLISIPRLLEEPPKGYLPDYPSQAYPFDVWDGQTKTLVYCTDQPYMQQRWQGSYTFCADNILCVMNKLYTMKGNEIYEHNQLTSFNTFYGVNSPSRIMVVANQVPQRPKVYNNISVESNMKPSFVYFYNNYPYLQTSDLEDIDFRDLEGVFYATLYRNKIVPTNSGFTTDGLLTGEKMRNVAMKTMFEFEIDETPLELKYVNFGYQISRGHTT